MLAALAGLTPWRSRLSLWRSAIYAVNPVSEETARAAVLQIERLPVRPRSFPSEKALPSWTAEAGSPRWSSRRAEALAKRAGEAGDDEADSCPDCGGDVEATAVAGVSRCTECGMTIPRKD